MNMEYQTSMGNFDKHLETLNKQEAEREQQNQKHEDAMELERYKQGETNKRSNQTQGKGKSVERVYVDKETGARHVVNLNNQEHRRWLAKYGDRVVPEKNFEDGTVDDDQSGVSGKKLTYNPKTGKLE
jgi:hypothetical protein